MNLLAIRNETLAHGFDSIQYGARVNQYINDGYGLIADRVDYYVDDAADAFATVAQSSTYPLPADFGRMRSLFDSDRRVELQAASIRQIDRSSFTYGTPQWYAILGTNVVLYPFPDGVYNVTLRYWKTPTALVNDTDTPTLPAEWCKLLWKYAVWQAFEADDDPSMGSYWKSQFENDLAEFAADVKFPNTDGAHQVAGMWNQDDSLSQANGWGFYGI